MTDSIDSRITANHRKSLRSDDRFVIRTPLGCESVADPVMTDSRRGSEGGGDFPDRIHVSLPLAIIDGIWPTGMTLLSRRKRTSEEWFDTLEREVDRGLLRRVGHGTEESPYRYEEVAPGVFTVPPKKVGLLHPTTQRLVARLGLRDAR
jgi:hypothetical protein